jgi:hypothetical protein
MTGVTQVAPCVSQGRVGLVSLLGLLPAALAAWAATWLVLSPAEEDTLNNPMGPMPMPKFECFQARTRGALGARELAPTRRATRSAPRSLARPRHPTPSPNPHPRFVLRCRRPQELGRGSPTPLAAAGWAGRAAAAVAGDAAPAVRAPLPRPVAAPRAAAAAAAAPRAGGGPPRAAAGAGGKVLLA